MRRPPLFFSCPCPKRRFLPSPMGNTAAFFSVLRGMPPFFLQPCPECRLPRFFFRTASAPSNRSFFAAAPARRTIARRRRIQNAGGLQGRNFRGIGGTHRPPRWGEIPRYGKFPAPTSVSRTDFVLSNGICLIQSSPSYLSIYARKGAGLYTGALFSAISKS